MAGKSTIGAGLAIDGEKEFRNAVTGINREMSVLASEMKKVTAQYDNNADSLDGLNAKSAVYEKQADAQRKKIETLKEALANAGKEYGENSKEVQNWQIKLNNAEADLAKTENSIRKTANQIDDFGKEANDGGDDVEKAGKQAKEAGDKAEKSHSGWAKLGDGLKKTGELAGKAVMALGAAAATAGTALVGASVSAAGYADDVLTLSTQTGIATDDLQKFKYASELVDVSTETLTKSMAKNIKSMKGVQDGTKLSVEAYKKLGVSALNADGTLRDGQTVYWETIDALGKMENETERDALAMQILGKSAQELNPLIEAGSARMQELGEQAEAAGYVMSGDTLDAFGKFDDNLQTLKVGAEGAKNALGTVLLPMLTTLSGDGVDLLGNFTKGINDANGDIGKMMDVVSTTMTGIVDTIMQALPQIIDMGMQIIGGIGKGILDNLPIIIDSAVEILTSLINGLIEALPQLIDGALQIVMALSAALLDNLPLILQAGITVLTELMYGITEALPVLIPAIVDAVLLIVDTLIDNIDMLIDASIAIIMALADGLIEALPRLIDKIPEIIDKLIQAIVNNGPKILEAGIEIIIALAEGLIQAIPQLVAKIPEIILSIVQGFGSFFENMKGVGKNLITGLWNGIKDAGAWLKEKISGFVDDVVGKIKNFFGIHSPSTVMAGIGGFLSEGLADGITDKAGLVSKAMDGINKDLVADANIDVSGGRVGPGGYVTSNLYMDSVLVAAQTGKAQYRRTQGYGRAMGVVPV